MLLVVFASTYWIVAAQQAGAFTEPLNRTDGLYFTVTVFSTVGFGDITPVSQLARVLVTVQMLVGLVTVGLIAKLVVGAVQVAVARRAAEPGARRTSDLSARPATPGGSPCSHDAARPGRRDGDRRSGQRTRLAASEEHR